MNFGSQVQLFNQICNFEEIREMLPKMRDWGVRDSSSFTVQHFHDSVHISNTFLGLQKNAMPSLATCKFLPSLFEYIHHFSGEISSTFQLIL